MFGGGVLYDFKYLKKKGRLNITRRNMVCIVSNTIFKYLNKGKVEYDKKTYGMYM